MRALVGLALVSVGLSGCFEMPVLSKGKVSTLDDAPRLASTVSSTESKSIAAYDPNSKVATTIAAPSGNLAGSSITLPAGALAISAQLVVEEAVPLAETSVATSLAINPEIAIKPVGTGLIIRPTAEVDLTKPLTIQMPINPTAGLNTWLSGLFAANASGKYYTVFYKYFVNGELKAGAIPTASLQFAANGAVVFEGYFGAYWLAEVSAPIQTKVEVKTEEPIVNKDKVAVIANTGVVTEETIVAKAAIPTVDWKSIALTYDATKRSVTAMAAIGAGRTLSNCLLDLFERTDAASGINLATGSALTFSYAITKAEAHTLYGRFRCIDDQQRLTISGWSVAASIPALPATVATPKATTDYCGTTPPEIRLFVGATGGNGGSAPAQAGMAVVSTAAALNNLKAFTSLGNCVYSVELDTLGAFAFGIQTADMKTTCSAATAALGTQSLTCSAANGAPAGMSLPQGNYVFKLDFSASTTNPKLSVSLQPCSLGDLYLLRGDTMGNYAPMDATTRMTHLGGCQYTIDSAKGGSYGMGRVRIQNQSGTYACGNETLLSTNGVNGLVCGAANTYYGFYVNGGNVISYRFLLNLGNNLDRYGMPTTVPYLAVSEIDNCMVNFYMLGNSTAAGSNRISGVNSFRKGSYCAFNFGFMGASTPTTPFYIGIGEGDQKCGVTPGYNPSTYAMLDCSANAAPIDMQAYIYANTPYNIALATDYATGSPASVTLSAINTVCSQDLYLLPSGISGFQAKPSLAMVEAGECLYQYDWTPTATQPGFMLFRGSAPSIRCGAYAGFMSPAVNGAATDFACLAASQLNTDFTIKPSGVTFGTRYRVTADFRLDGYGNPRVSITPSPAQSCPDLHVIGLYGMPNVPDPSNKMTRTGDCNYSFNFRVGNYYNSSIHITNSSGTFMCGRDINAAYAYPDTGGRTTVMDCIAPSDLYLSFYQNNDYTLQVHYEAGGTSWVSLYNTYNSCQPSSLDGPAAFNQAGAWPLSFSPIEQNSCIEELVWIPSNTQNGFTVKQNYSGPYTAWCGLDQGQSQLSISGVERNAICNVYNQSSATNFAVSEGVSVGQKYLIRFDRTLQSLLPPKMSLTRIKAFFSPTATWKDGFQNGSTANSTSFPGSRRSAATWIDTAGNKYLFGGYGVDNNGVYNRLTDLWKFDGTSWTLLPSGDYGIPSGFSYGTGVFHPSNRPSARENAVAMFDATAGGRLWLFGGYGLDLSGQTGYLGDLWVFDLTLNQWAYMGGTVFSPGVSAVDGVAAHSNHPGSRHMASGFATGGRLYIFGGDGYSIYGSVGRLNDLWVFDYNGSYAASTWTFLGGSTTFDDYGNANWPSARYGHSSWRDASGNFWIWSGNGMATDPLYGNIGYLSDMWSYSVSTGTWTRRGGPGVIDARGVLGLKNASSNRIWPGARIGASTFTQADGSLWMFGGDGYNNPNSGWGLLNDAWRYDPLYGEWTWVAGSTQSVYGMEVTFENQVSTFGTQGVPSALNHPGSRRMPSVWPDASGGFWIFGGEGFVPGSSVQFMSDLWYIGL